MTTTALSQNMSEVIMPPIPHISTHTHTCQFFLVEGRCKKSNAKVAAAHPEGIRFLMPQVCSMCTSQYTLSDANTAIAWSDVSFDAADASAAKDEILRVFGTVHANGRVRCINSRHNYVYCKCSQCGATAACKPSTSRKWAFSSISDLARNPCTGLNQSVHVTVQRDSPAPTSSTISGAPFLVAPAPSLYSPPVQFPPTSTCCICEDKFQRDVLFECPNPAAHLMCQDCFESNVSSQFGEDIQAFINRNCEIICSYCSCETRDQRSEPFNMQALMPR